MAEQAPETTGGADLSHKRNLRRRRVGLVTSEGRNKTIRVRVERLVRHARFDKYMRKWTTLHAHDERNEAKVGDKVQIMECRPYSKTKHWRLVQILERAADRAGVSREQLPA
jgi:small subunit ribosomal protein S17